VTSIRKLLIAWVPMPAEPSRVPIPMISPGSSLLDPVKLFQDVTAFPVNVGAATDTRAWDDVSTGVWPVEVSDGPVE